MPDARQAPVTDEMLEDCLQAVQRLARAGQPLRLAEIAAFARLSAARADAVLAALRERGLLERSADDGLRLTAEGERQAAAVLRRHRLSERLFTDILGLPWERAHEEAMRLEHSITPDGEARLAHLLDHPDTCPHGGPIPAADGSIPASAARPLDQVAAGTTVQIQQIADEDREFLRYLASLGLLPKTDIRVEEVAPFGGPLLVRVGTARYALGRDVAARILVQDALGDARHRHRRRRRGDSRP
jgi:DtxR family Mn-dependent transcriptional regulator